MLKYVMKPAILLVILLAVLLGSCAKNRKALVIEERGMFAGTIRIRSLPTKAKIFINEKEIGETPLTYKVRHEERRMINIKAVPVYPNQYTQNIFVMLPPVPKTMTIYMNHYPEDYDRNKDNPFVPPEKPKPEVIVQTEVDTVFVDRHSKETKLITLPIIFFETDSFALSAAEIAKMQSLVEVLLSEPDYSLDIYGFADSRASEKHNITLTLNRANAVKEYLAGRGIDPARMYVYGHGKVPRVTSAGLDMDLSQSRKVLFLLKKPE